MTGFDAQELTLVGVLPLYSIVSVTLVRRGRRVIHWLVAIAVAAPLIFWGATPGAPEMSLVLVGVPVAGAAFAAQKLRSPRTWIAQVGIVAIMSLTLLIPAFLLGLLWGIVACEGGCL